MIDKETWNVEADCDKMKKIIKYKIFVQYHKFSSFIKFYHLCQKHC